MPPAISDEEGSDAGEVAVPLRSTRAKKPLTSLQGAEEEEDDDEMPDAVKGDVKNGDGDDDNEEEGEDDSLDENLEPDEFIVEKIIGHEVKLDGSIFFRVKWEGYEKKSDQTLEDEDNLRENASDILEEYLKSVGGRQRILDETKTAVEKKKRGRPSTGTPVNGTKRRRNGSHPASSTPPTSGRPWQPPVGSWEDEVGAIDACHDENTGKLIVYVTWKNGHKTQHDTKVIYQRCPQKMLQFYERHVKIVMASDGGAKDEITGSTGTELVVGIATSN
ncbi:heterochromatin protein one [Hypoxylon crocopeplum]|nr:heterochromatin protein one [Hypoxylon crocopeplum]